MVAQAGRSCVAEHESRGGTRSAPLVLVLLLLVCALALLSLLVGPAALAPRDVLDGLLTGHGADGLIAREIRLPRLLLSLSIGGTLGLCGAATQGLLRNPLGEPAIFGAPQAAALGAVIVLYSGTVDAFSFALPVAAILGAAVSAVLILMIVARDGNLVTLILSGLAVSSLAAAATSLAINLSPDPYAVTEIVFWLMGSLEDRSFRHVEMAAPFLIVSAAMILYCGPGYAALTLGEDTAKSLGIHVGRLRALTVAAVAIGVGAGVAVAGAIGFVGLVAPHFVRSFVGGDPKRILIPAGLAGAALLTAADIAVRLIPAQTEIRIGVLTAALGVPVFLYLVLTQRAFFGGEPR